MIDIIERLRAKYRAERDLCLEAADEIARLREALELIAGMGQDKEPKPLIFWQDIARAALDRNR
jgi:hypothetical protein